MEARTDLKNLNERETKRAVLYCTVRYARSLRDGEHKKEIQERGSERKDC
jgi:hypothetical protein